MTSFKERAAELWWFNAVDFGDFQSRGRDKLDAPPNASLYGTFDLLSSLDLHGKRCIDIGSGSGVVALGMKALGAEYVAAVDAKKYATVELGREITKEEIDYRMLPVESLRDVEEWRHSFDVVVSSGLMYHLMSPFELVYAARLLLKDEGVFILQSLTVPEEKVVAGMYLNTARNVNGDASTFVVPSTASISGMLRSACFDIVAERSLVYKNKFHAWMSRAKKTPEMVSDRTAHMKQMHEWAYVQGENFGGYDLRKMLGAPTATTIPEVTPERRKTIDEYKLEIDFPYNPKRLPNPVGLTR